MDHPQPILTRYRRVIECGQVDLEKEITMPKLQPSFTAEFKHEAVQLARTSVDMLLEELREHMVSAGREFTRGLGTFAHELADNFEKIADEREEDVGKDE
jgi:hypothetical protein